LPITSVDELNNICLGLWWLHVRCCLESTMELILNHTTLFYYNISSTKMSKTEQGPVASWVDHVSYQTTIKAL